jgi:hypothetical protein
VLLQNQSTSPADTYIVAPHTAQTIPILHAQLAKMTGDSQGAIEKLRPVRLMQYFDFAGLTESITEVNERLYKKAHEKGDSRDYVLIQGIGSVVSATHRRSGLVQANALLSDLMRNVVQLARSIHVLVMLEFPIDVQHTSNVQQEQDTRAPRAFRNIDLESAFSGSHGEGFRLSCGHQTLATTLETSLDCIIAVHDGLGRLERRKKPRERVVEVVKDRNGDLTGTWVLWKEP